MVVPYTQLIVVSAFLTPTLATPAANGDVDVTPFAGAACLQTSFIKRYALGALEQPTHNEGTNTEPQFKWQGIVISLERRRDRINHFFNRIGQQPVLQGKFCRLSATDAHNETKLAGLVSNKRIKPETVELAKARDYSHTTTNGRYLTLGSIGVYDSHIRAMERIAKNESIDFGVIAEDDLSLFSDDFEQQFRKLVDLQGEAAAIWNSTGFLYLQSCNQGWARDTVVEPRLSMQTVLRDVSSSHCPCLGMYAVSRSAAKMLTALDGPLLPMESQIDETLPHKVAGLQAKAFYPSIAQTLGSVDAGSDAQILPSLPQISLALTQNLTSVSHQDSWVDC